MNKPLTLKYYGISPWEIEVAYGYLMSRFEIEQEEIPPDEPDFVSGLYIDIPAPFSEEFFEWFDFRRWEKMKALLKEMKRRRGQKNRLKITIRFLGSPNIKFILDAIEKASYDNAVEKIDFVLELLPYHLDHKKIPFDISEAIYRFDERARRWRLNEIIAEAQRFKNTGTSWQRIT